ncbi:hypothetical protein BGZ68_003409 [Mortierella alpina]|nr:hypothetical protein BGZ68_003409 [Mortierella alpina]
MKASLRFAALTSLASFVAAGRCEGFVTPNGAVINTAIKCFSFLENLLAENDFTDYQQMTGIEAGQSSECLWYPGDNPTAEDFEAAREDVIQSCLRSPLFHQVGWGFSNGNGLFFRYLGHP